MFEDRALSSNDATFGDLADHLDGLGSGIGMPSAIKLQLVAAAHGK